MNRLMGALLGAGALIAVASVMRGKREEVEMDERAGAMDRNKEDSSEHIDVSVPPLAEMPDSYDNLPATHKLSPDEAERLRAQARLDKDAALSPERETMFERPEESGEAGSMVRPELYNDRNLIGRQS